jgi:hypothetical protein
MEEWSVLPGNCAETPVVEIANRVRLSASPNGTSGSFRQIHIDE